MVYMERDEKLIISSLNENEKKVLIYLIKSGPQNQYQLSTKTGINRYATIKEICKRFKGLEILSVSDAGAARTGLQKKEWRLTVFGSCVAIRVFLNNFREVRCFREFWEPFPGHQELYADFMKIAKSLGLKDDLSNLGEIEPLFRQKERKEKDPWRIHGEAVDDFVRLLHSQELEARFNKYLDSFLEDPELRKAFSVYVQEADDRAAAETDWANCLKGKLEQTKT
jgi:hypothetical protein